MSEFQCELQIPNVPGLEDQQLTVGRIFYYNCQGNWSPQLNIENLQAQFVPVSQSPELSTYAVRVLGFEMRDTKTADIKLVSYMPGSHQIQSLKLNDGTTQVELPGFQIQVQSILKQEQGGSPPQPFGLMGPFSIAVPWVYWVILISVIGISLFSFLLLRRKRLARKEVLDLVIAKSQGNSAILQFHRELRSLSKISGLSDLDQKLKIEPINYLELLKNLCDQYWGQKLNLALLGRSRSYLFPEFKKYAPKHYIKFKKELQFWDQRFSDLAKGRDQASFEDFVSFTTKTRELIENMENFQP